MIPVLYESTATSFNTFGLGALAETTSCVVTEERNGKYELELKYPVNGAYYDELQLERIIKAKPNDTAAPQAFRIYRISKPMKGNVTVFAQHISYDLAGIGEMPWSTTSMSAALVLQQIATVHATESSDFELTTDFEAAKPFSVTEPQTIRATLGGTAGSMLDVWGGEWEWNNFVATLHAARGADNGVVIEYAKNLTGLTAANDTTGVYTLLLPYCISEDNVITLPEKVLPITTALTVDKVLVRDFSDAFDIDTTPTEAQLREVAEAYLEANPLGVPTPTITVNFEPLWKLPEYAALIERVSLCDVVTVRYTDIGVDVKQKVVKTVYDTLQERYTEITLGKAAASMVTNVVALNAEVEKNTQAMNTIPSRINAAVQAATALITGQTGGYVVINTDTDTGKPYEILIMDYPRIEDAVNVWRWNMGGLGFSSNGYNGPYTTAITQDGSIVADFIKAGTIDANLLRAGTIMSPDGLSYWDLTTGAIRLVSYDNTIESLSDQVATAKDMVNDAAEAVAAMESRVAQLEVSNATITAKFSEQLVGGVNFIRNSGALNGTNDWTYTGTVGTVQNTDTAQNTVAGAAFTVNANATLTQQISGLVPGTYTVGIKAKRTGGRTGYVSSAVIDHDGVQDAVFSQTSSFEWTKFTKTLTISGTEAIITLKCTSGVLTAADIIMTQGETEHAWTPAANEIYTTEVKVDRRGIEVSNSDSRQRTVITNEEFAGYYDEEKIFTLNKDETQMKKTTVDGVLTIGKVMLVPRTDVNGLNVVVLD